MIELVCDPGLITTDGVDTLLVLDVDGVFNPFYSGTFKKSYYNVTDSAKFKFDVVGYRGRVKSRSYVLRWSKELVAEVNALVSLPNVRIVWLTTWHERMAEVELAFGINPVNESASLAWGIDSSSLQSSKVLAFRNLIRAGDKAWRDRLRVVWVDDTLFASPSPQVLMYNGTFNFGYRDVNLKIDDDRLLLVGPDCRFGISRENMSGIKDFVLGS